MQSKKPLLQLVIVTSIGVALALIIVLYTARGRDHQNIADVAFASSLTNIANLANVESSVAPRAGLPVRLKIPKIDVNAAFEYVGATDGIMDVPKGPDNVGWFSPGPRPGETGSAVIAGHEGWKDDIPAVFDDLHALSKGDPIYILDDAGAMSTYVVREKKTFKEHDDSSSVFLSDDGIAHLNLITCGGVWDAAKKSYPNRLVVFADRESGGE